jgi:hypothetical protein
MAARARKPKGMAGMAINAMQNPYGQ